MCNLGYFLRKERKKNVTEKYPHRIIISYIFHNANLTFIQTFKIKFLNVKYASQNACKTLSWQANCMDLEEEHESLNYSVSNTKVFVE